MTETMINVAEIRFTQEHVYDSFNSNDSRAGSVMTLIEAILNGTKTVRDMPLIRVAWKRGAYWCVDNRRLFVYKHCQLGEIPVIVMEWKSMREFELKWKNGLSTRAATSEGRRVGMIQRTDTPLCRSPVFEPSLSELTNLLDPEQQRKHDELIAANRRRRDKEASARSKAESKSAEAAAADALRGLLQLPSQSQGQGQGQADPKGKKKGKKKREMAAAAAAAAAAAPEEDEDDEEEQGPPAKKRKKGAKRKAKASAKQKKLETANTASAAAPLAASGAGAAASAGAAAPVKLTVAMAEDSSDDDAYAVEVTAM